MIRGRYRWVVFGLFAVLWLGSMTWMTVACGTPTGNEPTAEGNNRQEPPAPRDGGDEQGGESTVMPEPSPELPGEPACIPSVESCNGQDDDCDGTVDNMAPRSCYSGAEGTEGVGACRGGSQVCTNGQWGPCEGEIGPAQDGMGACDSIDGDCDGKTDEGCSCMSGATQPCGQDEGSCTKGTQTCAADGTWGTCEGEVAPTTETCDNTDEDCDGKTDEGLQQGCYDGPAGTEGVGTCQQGQQTCSAGQWGACEGAAKPQAETCDGKDTDCDGKTDEGLSMLSCGQGPCANTVEACTNGQANTCQPRPAQQAESCNGQDDDCDGTVDNGATCPAGQQCSMGSCQNTGGAPYRTGTFQSPGRYTVVGTVSVFKTSNGERFEFSTNFSSSNGPDLYIYLVQARGGAVSGNNYISLGKLKSTRGQQSYTLNQSSTGYQSIVVWCQLASANFGYANLTP